MADIGRPKFSPGEDDESRLMAETTALVESKWALDETRQGLEKTFNFPTYAKALVSPSRPYLMNEQYMTDTLIQQDFILLIGVETKLQNHHPELKNVSKAHFSRPSWQNAADLLTPSRKSYKSVFYHWTTHVPRGLSSKDLHMARLCDDKAKLLGHQA